MKLLYEPTDPTDIARAGPGPLGDDNPRTTGGPPFPVATTFNPLTGWTTDPVHGVWASDPLWTPPADGGAVSSWRNGGSVGGDLVQATGSKQPTYRASVAALNGAPAVQWDATDDLLSVASIATVSQPWYWVFVANATGAASTRRLASNNGGTSWVRRDVTTDDLTVNPGTSNVTAAGTLTGAHLLIGVGNGASSAASIDGVATTGGSGTATWTLIHLGASSAATESWAGHIAYAALFTTDPTGQAEWTAFKAWVTSTYGITVA